MKIAPVAVLKKPKKVAPLHVNFVTFQVCLRVLKDSMSKAALKVEQFLWLKFFRDLPRAVYSGLFLVTLAFTLTTTSYFIVLSRMEVLQSTTIAMVSQLICCC